MAWNGMNGMSWSVVLRFWLHKRPFSKDALTWHIEDLLLVMLRVVLEAPAKAQNPGVYAADAVVQLFSLQSVDGDPVPLAKRSLLGANRVKPFATLTVSHQERVKQEEAGKLPPEVLKASASVLRWVTFEEVPAGFYTVVAFIDHAGNGKLDFSSCQPLGWLSAKHAWGDPSSVIKISGDPHAVQAVHIVLRHATRPPSVDRRVEGGAFGLRNGLPVVHLWGPPRQRGYAQGILLGRQVLDFLEFFIIEDFVSGTDGYAVVHSAFASELFSIGKDFMDECEGMVSGIIESTQGGFVHILNRTVDAVDIICLNAPTLIGCVLSEHKAGRLPVEETPVSKKAKMARAAPEESLDGACTQFACWGSATASSDVKGGTIVGRNMDGECDVRKVTVTHLLVIAVEPEPLPDCRRRCEREGCRFVSILWAGAVGVQTGMNSAGLWCASNGGSPQTSPFIEGGSGHPLNTAAIMHVLTTKLPPKANPSDLLPAIHALAAPSGGIRVSGQELLIAQPYDEQRHGGAYVYEGDHKGGQIRTAADSDFAPFLEDCIMVANHNMVRGCAAPWIGNSFGGDVFVAGPESVFGTPVSFSSLWRYKAGASRLSALRRSGQPIGTTEMKQLLQTVTEGLTEYSVIARPNDLEFEVAVGNLEGLWDAPYGTWHLFRFDDVFIGAP